ncbi:MAG: ATP-binding protein [Coriobacteriales bacterium]|jgi:predicted AAA+ superfamily ATPase|nr:ATP-binding protein [Coriobacteriales bacterium]
MERKITQDLLGWKNNPRRKPLILNGARQTGKTFIVRDFGQNHFEDLAYFNLEKSQQAANIFDGNIDPQRLVGLLSAIHGKQIEPDRTLIFLDEVQASERALTSLKYFQEDAPEFHVVAAGSLLGIAVSRKKISYPVGKVDMMTLYPMDFEEFLWALERQLLSEAIRESYEAMHGFPLHTLALDFYRQYLIVGGMPEVVAAFAQSRDYTTLGVIHETIMDSYIADITRYADANETVRILEAYNSLSRQLLKENRKFQYSAVRSGARASQFLYPLAWLDAARLTLRCNETTSGLSPLKAFENPDAFKVYLSDVGLLCSRYEVNPIDILEDELASTLFKGALAENYVMQHLVSNGFSPLYWGKPRYAEVDFVITDSEGRVVPLEVKSGDSVRSKSLTIFREKYQSSYAIRCSAKNFGFENQIKAVPLYAAFCIR